MEKDINTPKLRFPKFTAKWEKKKLGEFCKMQAGKFISASEINENYNANLYPCYGGNGLRGYTKKYNQNGKYTLIGRQGAHCGNVILVNGKFYATEHAVVVTLNKDFDTNWIFFLLESLNLNQYSTGLAQPGLSVQTLEKVEAIISTSLTEQQKNSSFFTTIDTKINQLKKKKELLEEYKKGIVQKIFSQELRFKDEKGKEFPKWEKKYGNQVFESVSNKQHNSDLPILAITQGHGAIPRNLIDFKISVTDKSIETYKVVEIGDFIISLRSFQGGIEYSRYNGICSPAYIVLKPILRINDHFFKHYFKTESYITLLNKKIEGIRDGKMVSYNQFSEIELPFPSYNEQTKIANFLSAIDEKTNHCQTQIEQTEKWKKGLLQKMFC